jgi:LCP family protein required for cell wall assembly
VLIATNVTVFALIAGAATVVGYASYELNRVGRVKVGGLEIGNGPTVAGKKARDPSAFTMLIVGADTRDLKKPTGLGVGNDVTNAEDLSDSIILARVSPATHQVALLSIPRDLFVSIPGLGVQKINAAFSGGDPTRLVKVITTDLGIPINHYAEVNFDSFEEIADAIGGVEQYFPSPAYDHESGLVVPKAGCVNLVGPQALAFVRSRNYFYEYDGQYDLQESPESDLGRIQRQQAFIKDAIKKAERTGDLTDPLILTKVISSLAGGLTLDTTFSDDKLIDLASDFSHLDANAIPNLTYPVVNDGDGLDRVPSADAAVVAEFENLGTTSAAAAKKRPAKHATTTTPTTTARSWRSSCRRCRRAAGSSW